MQGSSSIRKVVKNKDVGELISTYRASRIRREGNILRNFNVLRSSSGSKVTDRLRRSIQRDKRNMRVQGPRSKRKYMFQGAKMAQQQKGYIRS